jgi:hypothetical protein
MDLPSFSACGPNSLTCFLFWLIISVEMENQRTLLELPSDLPDFSSAMNNLGRVPLILYQSLERAASKTASFRDVECPNEKLDEGLAATLLRFYAKRYLSDAGIEAQLDKDWTLDWLPFLGMSFHHNGYHVRILKGSGGCLPGCGTSEKKVLFYGQIPSMYLIGTQPCRTTANLLVLWGFDFSYGLSGLWLALPAVGGSRAEDVSAFWCEPIPHPSEGLLGIIPPPTPPNDDLGGLIVPLSQDEGVSKRK